MINALAFILSYKRKNCYMLYIFIHILVWTKLICDNMFFLEISVLAHSFVERAFWEKVLDKDREGKI